MLAGGTFAPRAPTSGNAWIESIGSSVDTLAQRARATTAMSALRFGSVWTSVPVFELM
jgi:hypothetical protein